MINNGVDLSSVHFSTSSGLPSIDDGYWNGISRQLLA